MNIWMRTPRLRPMVWLLTALALGMISCSAEDKPNGDSGRETGSDVEAATEPETRVASSLLRGDEIDDPAAQARIEAFMRDAEETLVRAADFLAEQSAFRVVADISFDALQSDGRLLEFGGSREITIRRPDRIRMREVRRDGDTRTVYFDGSTISIDLPGHRAYVQIDRPGTLYDALDHLIEDLGAPVPMANLFSESFASQLQDQITYGYSVGTAEVAGRSCEHLSFRMPEVDVQLWVEEGDRPLIARIVISYKHEEGNPQFRANLRDWDLTIETPETLFHFEPAEGSEPLVIGSTLSEEMAGAEETE